MNSKEAKDIKVGDYVWEVLVVGIVNPHYLVHGVKRGRVIRVEEAPEVDRECSILKHYRRYVYLARADSLPRGIPSYYLHTSKSEAEKIAGALNSHALMEAESDAKRIAEEYGVAIERLRKAPRNDTKLRKRLY